MMETDVTRTGPSDTTFALWRVAKPLAEWCPHLQPAWHSVRPICSLRAAISNGTGRISLPLFSHRPILHLQPSHAPELPLVIGNQRQPRRLGMRRNPQIVVPDHLPLAFQFRPHRSISFRRRLRQSHYRKHARQLLQQLQRRRPLRALLGPVHEFPERNHGERRLSLLQHAKSPQHFLRLFPPDVDANVRVQQEARFLCPGRCCGARLHHSPLRSCGLSFFRPGCVKSAGSAASKSNARAIVPVRSRRTISSPRRDISTSLLFTRNAFGSRTAWLFPDLNTFAVAIVSLTCIYAKYTHFPSNLAKSRRPSSAAHDFNLTLPAHGKTHPGLAVIRVGE